SGMAIGRVLTVLASAGGVVLAGLLVRHRGALAALIACGVLAVFPDSIAAAHTVLVEPWLVLFCLLGAVAVFDRDRLTASRRRLAWGGLAFGFAGAIEGWAIIPVLVVAAICLPWIRRTITLGARVRPADHRAHCRHLLVARPVPLSLHGVLGTVPGPGHSPAPVPSGGTAPGERCGGRARPGRPAQRRTAGLGGDRAGGGRAGGVHDLPSPRRGQAQSHPPPDRA